MRVILAKSKMSRKKYTIFYSWQTDTTEQERRLIGTSLEKVCAKIFKERGISLRIDESTLGEPGMPSITETIFKKIDNSDIFVCDLTPIIKLTKKIDGGQQENKQLPNSNVLVELGYAMSAIGLNYVIPLAHRGDWSANQLPFDINHHKIDIFTSSNIDAILYNAISKTLDYIKENGTHRRVDTPYVVYLLNRTLGKIADCFKSKYVRDEIQVSTSVFFRERMCYAFSGNRGLVEYTKNKDIKRALTTLLANPLLFQYCIDERDCDPQPIWWFERGSSLPITHFKHLAGRRYLIGMDECVIKRIVAYSDPGRYYSNYVYVETEIDKPTGLYKNHNKAFLERVLNEQDDYTEEFAVFSLFPFYNKQLTRQEYDDGCFYFMGKVIQLHQKAELRCRHLTPYNFIIAAKFSAFNNLAFDRTSKEVLNAVLRGELSNEDFNKYMLTFPKPVF